jgi:squalene-hopene/tetraprenyl-beta-curcumene cyclase
MPEQKPETIEKQRSPSDSPAPEAKSGSPMDTAIDRAKKYLLSLQHPDGYWVAELESNATMIAEYVFFMHFMAIWDPERVAKCKVALLKTQQTDGGWPLYYGGTSDISTTVESYVALRMAGVSVNAPEMVRALKCIFTLGGVRKARVFTKIFLAMLGQSSWDDVPAMPVEIILLPKSFYFNI